jgi:hypothetical protein
VGVAYSCANQLLANWVIASPDVLVVFSGSGGYQERTKRAAEIFLGDDPRLVLLTNDRQLAGWATSKKTLVELAYEELQARGAPSSRIELLASPISSIFTKVMAVRSCAKQFGAFGRVRVLPLSFTPGILDNSPHILGFRNKCWPRVCSSRNRRLSWYLALVARKPRSAADCVRIHPKQCTIASDMGETPPANVKAEIPHLADMTASFALSSRPAVEHPHTYGRGGTPIAEPLWRCDTACNASSPKAALTSAATPSRGVAYPRAQRAIRTSRVTYGPVMASGHRSRRVPCQCPRIVHNLQLINDRGVNRRKFLGKFCSFRRLCG